MRDYDRYLLTYGAYLEYAIEDETFDEYTDRVYAERELKELDNFDDHYYGDK